MDYFFVGKDTEISISKAVRGKNIMVQYAAGIVLYNPDINRLEKNLEAICSQVKNVYCFNNGLENEMAVEILFRKYTNIYMVGDGTNVGIATALNELIKKAKEDDIEWILTLDQDSVVCEGMVESLASIKDEKDVAIICPVIEDVRRKNEAPVVAKNTIDDVDFCITSGSFMNVEKALAIGGFDDWLFIGLVDNEICYRTKLNGYRIVRNNAVILNHELGNLRPAKFEKLYLTFGRMLHSETIKKLSYKREVNPMRLYYATRNMFYLKKRYVNYMNTAMWNKMIIKNSISSIIRGGVRLNLLKAIFAGIRDGSSIKVEPFVAQKK